MDLEFIIPSEISQKKTYIIWYHLMVNLKKLYEWTHLQNRNRLRLTDFGSKWLPNGKGGGADKVGAWDALHTIICKIGKQQLPTVYVKKINLKINKKISSVICNNLCGKTIWKRVDTCTCITRSPSCTLETNTTL